MSTELEAELERAFGIDDDVDMEDVEEVPEPKPKKKRSKPPKGDIVIPKSIEKSHQAPATNTSIKRPVGRPRKYPATTSTKPVSSKPVKPEEKSFLQQLGIEMFSKLGVLAVTVGGLALVGYLRGNGSQAPTESESVRPRRAHPEVNYEKQAQDKSFPDWNA
jgi:hypothetical protein